MASQNVFTCDLLQVLQLSLTLSTVLRPVKWHTLLNKYLMVIHEHVKQP